jgi:galactokinase
VSCPETDWLIKRAGEIDGIIFSRMTGKGFGGCTISLMTASALEEYRIKMEEYERIFGFRASYDVIMTDDGVRVEGSQYQSPSG